MEDQFWLRRAAIGPQFAVPITAERYSLLRDARSTLVDAGAFEQRYEILLGNYLCFEQFCAEWSLRGEVEIDYRYERWAKVILEANRHIMNLLSAARSYADHVVRDFGHLSLLPSFKAQANTLMSAAYDRSMSYRVMCALRNYVQHRATPVHGITSRMKSECWAETLLVYCDKKRLKEDGGFKAAVLAKIEDRVDLRRAVREYMRDISGVHIQLRKCVDEPCLSARTMHEEAIAEFVAAQDVSEPGNPGIGLSVCRESEGRLIEQHPVLLNWDDVRLLLAEKNRYALKL